MGHLLVKHTSAHAKIRKFLDSVPQLMNDIKKVHSGAVKGDLDALAVKEFRQQATTVSASIQPRGSIFQNEFLTPDYHIKNV